MLDLSSITTNVRQYYNHGRAWYLDLSRLKQIGLAVLAICMIVFAAVAVYNREAVLLGLISFSKSWNEMTGGWALLFACLVVVGFPPLIGYSALCSMTGMMLGFPYGWPFLAAGTIVGSSLSFLAFRYLFLDRAQQLIHQSPKLEVLTRTMDRHDSFTLLWMIRLCPLPYSLSNGALAAIHTVKFSKFVLATVITSPKLLIHIFIGDRLVRLGTEKDTVSKIVDFASIAIASLAGTATAYLIYKRTQVITEDYQAFDEAHLDDVDISDDEELRV